MKASVMRCDQVGPISKLTVSQNYSKHFWQTYESITCVSDCQKCGHSGQALCPCSLTMQRE